MNDEERLCCCGHAVSDHRSNGNGPCRVCHPTPVDNPSCEYFHDVGEGHGRAFEIFLVVVVLLAMAGVWKLTHR